MSQEMRSTREHVFRQREDNSNIYYKITIHFSLYSSLLVLYNFFFGYGLRFIWITLYFIKFHHFTSGLWQQGHKMGKIPFRQQKGCSRLFLTVIKNSKI